jgi:hypothetical protein
MGGSKEGLKELQTELGFARQLELCPWVEVEEFGARAR